MIMMPTVIQLKNSPTTLEIMSVYQARVGELGQNAVDGCQTYHFARLVELKINIVGTQMVLWTFLQHLQYFEPWPRGF